ncbi:unnamed protein product (macronuclear) [Paramecium tetraurelia]|uniref:Uncharacterized protein n=1 Tax=Paramecium tetraurelia TaxID=5888 RepID=A0EF11_PARTE|nr:uncharacterized protein GSPATT00026225001 [Paramecium tetraurelia]CAK93902.1 unnamed protein product [Paramecium tetraurelia]|eukprot:XP_001461275.1 hypothetical protein (macronuclear) [Paramecium tetraurelia strain d4-2]
MKHNKQQSHYVLDFSDIEDISDNESESSNKSNQQQQINQTTPTPNRIELQIPNMQVKKETVEIPSILIQEEEEPVIRRKLDFQNQQWQVNFDELSEQDQQESDRSAVAIEIPRDPSPPTVAVEEPQYIEQYFEDQNVIEEIDIEQEQLKMEQRKEQLKQDLITKKHQQQKQIPKVQQVQKEQQQVQDVNQQKNKNSEDKSKQVCKQKFYNPKNSLIYLRLKGREDLYKKQEYVIDEQTKPQDQDELLEGLECINNLLIGLSKIKDKKVGVVEKQQKILPLQIQKHRLDDKGDHHKESKLQKKDEKEKEKDNEQQKQNTKDAQKKDQQITELNIKQQQLQEAQQARQIRHEKQQQEKEKQRLLEQRQVYKILTKKQVNQGLILYKCQLRQKQKDSIKWLRYSEIALISKGESEIFNFEKRISDQLFMQLHKANMRSVVITKQAMFDVVTIHYVKEQKEVEEAKQKDKGQVGKNERENQIVEEKQIKEKKAIQNNDKKKKNQDQQKNEVQQQKSDKQQQKGEKQQQKGDKQQQKDKQLEQLQTQQLQQENEKDQQDAKRTKNKVSYLESDEEKKDEDLLDADSIQIFKITQERQRKIDKKDKEQKQPQSNQQQVEEQKQIESNELNQNNNNNQNKEQKKVKNLKIKECPLSRLETNDEIKKKEQINQKRKEKRRQEYQQYLNEIEQEQLVEVTHSKHKKQQKETKQQETNKQQIKSSNKGQKINNQQEIQNLDEQTNSKDKEETKQSNSTKRIGRQNTRNHKSPSPSKESIEPGYVSSKRIYENRDQKKKRLKVLEDEESEFSQQNVKQPQVKEQKKRVRQK